MATSWSNGLCDCCKDVGTCLMACCCPCIVHTQNQQARGEAGNFCMNCLMCSCCAICYQCCILPSDRAATRAKYNIQKGGCDDCPASCCCGPCALTQEHMEILGRSQGPAGARMM